jgi:gamma-glutamyltranspeptidase/glutathione hydrolase
VASVFAASVCEISHFGFGGERGAHLRRQDARSDRDQRSGPGAEGGDARAVRERGPSPSNGPLARPIPAMLDAMALALEAKGTMRLEQVMQPAIELADGFPMYEFLQHYLLTERKATRAVRVVGEDLLP